MTPSYLRGKVQQKGGMPNRGPKPIKFRRHQLLACLD
jgi:hypothetical protein